MLRNIENRHTVWSLTRNFHLVKKTMYTFEKLNKCTSAVV